MMEGIYPDEITTFAAVVLYGVPVAVAVLSYLLGCVNGAIATSHLCYHDDVRRHGSGNAGLTNFYRTYGAKCALMVIAFDMLKALGADKKALIVTADNNEMVVRASNNIQGVSTAFGGSMNVVDILNCDKFIISQDAVKRVEEVYAE